MALTKPADYIDWTDDSPAKVQKPPAAQLLAGWTAGEPPPYQWMNWWQCRAGQWIRYLDQTLAASQPNALLATNARIVGGGNWSFGATTGTLAWANSFVIALPGQPDAYNQVAAGSVVLTDGQVAYVNAAYPFQTTGNTTSGSNQLQNVAYTGQVAVGQSVTGSGIPAGTTVTAVLGSTVTLSQNATATAVGVTVTVSQSASLTVQVADEATMSPGPTTLVIARRNANVVYVGTGQGDVFRDGELKYLRHNGYLLTQGFTAGATLTARTPVYISPGPALDNGRTAGQIYPVDASAAQGAVRAQMLGLTISAASAGATVGVTAGGLMGGFSGLTPGSPYYVDPANPGALIASRPGVFGQYVVTAGVAISATQMILNAAAAAATQPVVQGAVQGTYAVATEAQFVAALASASASGGLIVIVQPITLTAAYTVPPNVVIEGGFGATVVSMPSQAQLILSNGSTLRDLWLTATQQGGTMVVTGANYNVIQNCQFTVPLGSTGTCVLIYGVGARLRNNAFVGVSGALATGINYFGGTDNLDDSSVFA